MNDLNKSQPFKIQFKEMKMIFRHKFRYLIPLNVKFAFFPNENKNQYFIIRTENYNNSGFSLDRHLCYVLTNENCIIQNVSSNAISMLGLQSHSAKDVTENIKQFNEIYLKNFIDTESEYEIESFSSPKKLPHESKKKTETPSHRSDRKIKLKQEILKNNYSKPTPILWIKSGNTIDKIRKIPQENNFILTVNEVREFGPFLGYMFKFEPLLSYLLRGGSSVNLPFIDGNFDGNFIPEIGKQFVLSMDKAAYIQQEEKSDVEKMRFELRRQAENTIIQQV